jgi:hypothetical protein
MAAIPERKLENTLSYPQQRTGTSELNMSQPDTTRNLRIALRVVGVAFIVGIYTFSMVWPSGWAWHKTGHAHYLDMIMGVYATLGVFLLIASHKPLEHLSLIWFTVWSSFVHAAIMGVQALVNPEHIAHLWGDVPILFAMGLLLAVLTPRRLTAATA